MNTFKFLNFLKKGDKMYFDVTMAEQKDYIEKLSIPKDDFERSFNQYKCQRFFSTVAKGTIL